MRHLTSTILTAALVLLLSVSFVSCASGSTTEEVVEEAVVETAETTTETTTETTEETSAMTPPSGEAPSRTPGEPPSDSMGGAPSGMGGAPGSSSSATITYTAVNTYESDATISNESIASTGTDENAILVTGGTVTVDGATVSRSSSDSTGGDNSSFYGVGAAILATSGELTVSNSTITTDSKGGAGVFAYGDSVVYVNDTTITTTQSTSGGIHVAGGGTLTAKNGGMFYSTNTESEFVIKDVEITYSEDSEFLLKVTGNSNARGWGSTGSNGADTTFTAISQELEGYVIWDSISQLDFYLTDGSSLNGAFKDDESNAGNGGSGYCSVYIDSTSSWVVTENSVVTSLFNEGTITGADGQSVTIVGTDGTVYVSGTGAYTITVDYYSTSASFADAGSID